MNNAATCLVLLGIVFLTVDGDAWSSAAGVLCVAGAMAIIVKTAGQPEE